MKAEHVGPLFDLMDEARADGWRAGLFWGIVMGVGGLGIVLVVLLYLKSQGILP